MPGAGLDVPVWILGSSLFGAQLAAALGLPFAFASHFAPDMMAQAIEIYRARFQPSAQLARPYVMLGVNVFAADTDEEAARLFTSMQQAFVALRRGGRDRCRRPSTRWTAAGRRPSGHASSTPSPAGSSARPRPSAAACRPSSSATGPTR